MLGVQKLIVSVSFGSQAPFRLKGKSCLDGDASSCYLGHGDKNVMDGQCQDKTLHCTDPSLEQERTNVTFRWIRQHTTSCPLRAGVVCCLATCAQGSAATVLGNWEFRTFWVLWGLFGVLCVWGMLVLLLLSLIFTGLGLPRCAFCWTCLFGGGWRGHFLRDCRGVSWITQTGAYLFQWWGCHSGKVMLYVLALVGLPSLRGRDACMVLRVKGASWRNCRQNRRNASFSPLFIFLLSRMSRFL